MDEPIIKRLIISGLTPAITADDISRRLTTFGSVKAADGFGLPDGLGESRKFGYVTLETTVGKLAKCMNLLSGSTWKGAKLRFGEAKPDFREKIALENKQAAEEPPKKKRKRFGGVEAEDMTPVTPENAIERPGWKVSALGRITRPVKMRPVHPLTDAQEEKPKPKTTTAKFTDMKKPEDEKKKKKRVKDPDSRARRRTIDMTKFGSTHLKGMFLDLEVPMSSKKAQTYEKELRGEESGDSDSDSEMVIEVPATKEATPPAVEAHIVRKKVVEAVAGPSTLGMPLPAASTPASVSIPTPAPVTSPKPKSTEPYPESTKKPSLPSTTNSNIPESNTDIQQERAQTLHLLASLFGGADDDDDWIGRESVSSDIDADELIKGDRMLVDGDNGGFEIVPLGASVKPGPAPSQVDEDEEDSDSDEEEEATSVPKQSTPQEEVQVKEVKPKTLKDLFAPQEEEAGFSLLGHLDVDIELNDEVPYIIDQSTQQPQDLYEEPTRSTPALAPAPVTLHTHIANATLVLDPRQALFFPLPQHEGIMNRARQRDVYDLAKDNGWNWRDPAVGFFRTGTEEDIKKRWEESKGDLTRDWKRRCKEAGKVSRRKRGGLEGENEY